MKSCEKLKKVFRERIMSLGAAENLSEFARKCGLKQQDISRYLNDGALPVSDKLVKIATCFRVTTDWLLGLSDARSPENAEPGFPAAGLAVAETPEQKVTAAEKAPAACPHCAAKDAVIADQAATLKALISQGVGFTPKAQKYPMSARKS